jgi:methylmalonyl-CoA mutase, N-terminal domain
LADDPKKRAKAARERWERETVKSKAAPVENPSGRKIRLVYTPEDFGDEDYLAKLGFPGEHPFTRGAQPTLYRGKLWTMRQYAGFGTAEETNRRYRYLLKHGTTGLSVAFDLPTQIGYDSDDPMAVGEVGRTGVAVSSVEDMQRLFEGIPLDRISTSMTINAPASTLWAMYVAVAEAQGVAPAKLEGTIQNDILKEYIARGTYIYPPGPSMRLVANTFEYAAKHVPKWNPISISGYHIREAGSTAAQELAFTLADGIEYVQAGLKAGLAVDAFAPRLSFFFNGHNDLFEEIAKFRAARRLWAGLMKERFRAQDPRSWTLRFHTQTAGSMLTAQSPLNNVVRVALQALAATLGGTNSLHTNAYDEALALPTEKSARIALRTQQILAHETGVANTVDPFAGSWYVERLTDELEADARAYLDRIEKMGGMLRAIESGWVQKEIQDAAYRYHREVEEKRRLVVGVNANVDEEETDETEIHRLDPKVVEGQVRRLRQLRQRRDRPRHEAAVRALEKAAEGEANLMPFILDAVRGRATTGEIGHALRRVWGEYRPNADV